MSYLYILLIVILLEFVFIFYVNAFMQKKRTDLTKAADLDMINELIKRGILSAAPDGNGLSISPEVLRQVHFSHMHEQEMADIKNTINAAVIGSAMTMRNIHDSDNDHLHL